MAMMIGAVGSVGFRPLAAAAPRSVASSEAQEQDGVSLSFVAYKGARWPDLNPILQGPDRAAAVQKAEQTLEGWLSHNIPAADPSEKPFWTGLARWMARDMVDQARPEWQRGTLDDAHHAVELWSHEEGSPAPLRGEKGDPEKGVAFFRMMEGFLGDVRFRTRLASFLQSNDGKPAHASDLIHALGLEDHQMDGWFDNAGFPMVHARLDGSKVKLSQERMFLYPGHEDNSDLWSVPVRIRYKDSSGLREFKTILETRDAEVVLPAKGNVEWIYPNAGGKGFYRTDTAPPASDLGKLKAPERLAVLSNQWRLVRHNAAPVGKFLDQVVATAGDPDPSRLRIVLAEARFLAPRVPAAELPAWNAFVRSELTPAFERLGPATKPDEGMNDNRLRTGTIQLLTLAGDPAAQAVARQWGAAYLVGTPGVTPEMAGYSDDPAVADKLLAEVAAADPRADIVPEALRSLLVNPAQVDKTVSFGLEHFAGETQETMTRFLAFLNPPKALALMQERWDRVPGLEGMVSVSGCSPIRADVDQLVAARGSDALKSSWEQIKKTDGQAVNMADLPQKLSEWLRARQTPSMAAEEWQLFGV